MASRLLLSRSFSLSLSLLTPKHPLFLSSTSSLLRLRPISAVAAHLRRLSPAGPFLARSLSTRQTSSSLNDPSPNWSNRPPKETILLDGCDFEHWLVVMEAPKGENITRDEIIGSYIKTLAQVVGSRPPKETILLDGCDFEHWFMVKEAPKGENITRDEIIGSYIKTLAQVVGSEEEARMKIYSVSTKHYFAFGALVSEELSYKLKELEGVRWVLPDSYLDVRNKDYGGEPFINGEAVPYDPKYHAEWVRNNARANERNRRNDRPRNFDRSRNFERRDNMQNQSRGPNPPPNNMGPINPPNNTGPANSPNNTGPANSPNNMGLPPPNNMGRSPPNMGARGPNNGPNNMGFSNVGPNNMGQVPQNLGYAPNNMGVPGNVPNNQYRGGPNSGGPQYQNPQYQNPQYQNNDMRGPPQQSNDHLRNFEPNAPVGNNTYPPQNFQGRDLPPNYQ